MPQTPPTNARLNAVGMRGVTCMQCKGSGWVTCDEEDVSDDLVVDANGRLGPVSNGSSKDKKDNKHKVDVDVDIDIDIDIAAHDQDGLRLNAQANHASGDEESLYSRLSVLAPTRSIAELSTLSTDAVGVNSIKGSIHAGCDNYFESYTFDDVFYEYDDYLNSELDDVDATLDVPSDGLDDYARVSFVGTSNLVRTSTTDVVMTSLIDFVVCDVYEEAEPREAVLQVITEPVAPIVVVEKPQPASKMSTNLPGTIHAKGLGLVNAQPVADGEETWCPGFNRQLGARGRCAILDLVRRVYRQDPEYYKAILQSRNPPSSISSLPFFNIPMLWELSHQFGIFPQALQIARNHQSGSYNRTKRSLHSTPSLSSNSRHSSTRSHTKPKPPSKKSPKLTSKDVAPNYNAVLNTSETKTQSGRFIKRSKKYAEYSVETPTRAKTHGAAATMMTMTGASVEAAPDFHVFLASNLGSTSVGSGDELEPHDDRVHGVKHQHQHQQRQKQKQKSNLINSNVLGDGPARKYPRRGDPSHHYLYNVDAKVEAQDLVIVSAAMHTPKPLDEKVREQLQQEKQQQQQHLPPPSPPPPPPPPPLVQDGKLGGDGDASVDIDGEAAVDPLELSPPSLD